MTQQNAKTTELARLYALFEQLASRGSRSAEMDPHQSFNSEAPIPEDLTPVIKNLVGTRKTETKQLSGGRPRRNTVAGEQPSCSTKDDTDDDAESLAKFPVNKQFPFTFKMMLHKLYQLEDWGRTVKEFLEKSQMEFKPLAEQDIAPKDGSDVTASVRPATRARSQSMAGLRSPIHPDVSKATSAERHDETRALKKRCVGRTKSFSGPVFAEDGSAVSNWVYDATVSALEIPQRQSAIRFADTTPNQLKVENTARTRYLSLGAGQDRPIISKRRRMSAGAPPVIPTNPQSTPFQVVTNQSKQGTRRRAMTVVDVTPSTIDNMFRKSMKRPFTT